MRTSHLLSVFILALVSTTAAHAQSRWMSQFTDDGGRRYEIDVRGEVRFTDDDAGIASLSSDGHFDLRFTGSGGERHLVVRPGSGADLTYEYWVDGRKRPYDDSARRELAPVFLTIIRESGINAKERVARILRRKGVDGVMEEITHIGSSGANARYFTELVDQAEPTEDQLVRLAGMAPERIPSSGDKARFLIHAAPAFLVGDRPASAYFEAACAVASSGDRSRVLINALDTVKLSPSAALDLVECAESIPSSGDLSRVLIAAVPTYSTRPEYRDAYFEAASGIASSGDRSRVLLNVLEREDLDEGSMLSLLRTAAEIRSSGDKTRVLVRAADRIEGDRLVDAYLEAAESIQSSGDRGRALSALMAGD